MNGWEQVKLGDLYSVHNGISKGKQFFGKGYPFLSFSTVFNNWFLPLKLDSLVESTEQEQNSYSIRRGDVFITRTSETMDELGMSSVALNDIPNATYNGFTKRLRPTTNKVLPEFIGYYMRSPKFRGKFMAFSSMTTRASLSNAELLGMQIELPCLKMQYKIATILRSYDNLIDNYRCQIELLEEAAQRLYKEWFVDLRFPGYEHTKIVDGMPEGWEKKNIGELLEKIKRTKQIPSSEIRKNGLYPVIDQGKQYIAGYTNDVSAILYNENPIIVFGDHTRIIKLIPFPFAKGADGTQLLLSNDLRRMPQNLFYYSLKNVDLSNYSYARHFKYLKAMTIYLPSDSIAQNFNANVFPVIKEIQKYREQIIFLTEARDRLLPRLMSGEIKV